MSATNTRSEHDRAIAALSEAIQDASRHEEIVQEAITHLDNIIAERDEEITRLNQKIASLQDKIAELEASK